MPRAKVEEALEALVRSLTPARELVELSSAMFRDLWDRRAKEAKEGRTALKLETSAVEKKINQFLDRIVDTDSQTARVRAQDWRVGAREAGS